MPSVIFHASGRNFDPSSLGNHGLKPYHIHFRGQKSDEGLKSFIYEDSGFAIDLGPDDSDNLTNQIDAAVRFLDEHFDVLKEFTGLDYLKFDFGYAPRKDENGESYPIQCSYFPSEFLKKCGELSIGIELSLYTAIEGIE